MKVNVALAGFSPVPAMLDTAHAAAGVGVDGALVAEHLGYRDSITTAAALAVTSELEIGIVGPAPVSRHPALLAMELRSLAELAPGRVRVQVGLGDLALIAPLGGKGESALRQVREFVDALTASLAGVTVTGSFAGHTFESFKLHGPVPRIPVDVMAMRPKMVRLACHAADGVSLTTGATTSYLAEVMGAVEAELAAAGRRRSDFVVTANQLLVIDADRKQALRRARELLRMFSPTALAVISGGLLSEAVLAPWARGEMSIDTLLTDEIVASLVLVGTPDDVASRVVEIADIGIDVLAVAASDPRDADAIAVVTQAAVVRSS